MVYLNIDNKKIENEDMNVEKQIIDQRINKIIQDNGDLFQEDRSSMEGRPAKRSGRH